MLSSSTCLSFFFPAQPFKALVIVILVFMNKTELNHTGLLRTCVCDSLPHQQETTNLETVVYLDGPFLGLLDLLSCSQKEAVRRLLLIR